MSKKLMRWIQSKNGQRTLLGVVAAVVVLLLVGQVVGLWNLIPGPGTVLPPQPSYDSPPGGYTCLPSCADGVGVPQDGHFLSMPGADMASFGGESIVVWISVPGDYTTFEVGIFDGDSGKDNAGNINMGGGNWDNTTTEATYTLYADPLRNGQGTQIIGSWKGNSPNPTSDSNWTVSAETMPNNAWYTLNVNVSDAAKGPSGHYFYRLVATRAVAGSGINAFKLRSTAYLSTGQSDLVNASFAIVGMLATKKDVEVLYPQFQGDFRNMGSSVYTGEWRFYIYLPNEEGTMEFWDGDFDFGSWNCNPNNINPDICNTRDPLTPDALPEWANPALAVPQGTHPRGMPADDFGNVLFRREPAVRYDIYDPFGQPIYTNHKPSGSEEWKRFVISTDPSVPAHYYADKLGPGFYTWHIQGLDLHNTVWIRSNYMIAPICEDGPCSPPPVWPEGACPRTIGYWKNNVSKVLINNRTNGVQESRETLEWALNNVALTSPLFRSGINIASPAAIANPVRLTDAEADMILQRPNRDYPGDRNSMLARALQQNLAAWLNLGSGKLGPNTVVVLNVAGGEFRGTVLEALEEAQTIILSGGNLERAKDIADQMNNGLLGEEASDSVCADYVQVIPPDVQPPPHEEMPEGPLPEVPEEVTPAPTPDPVTCELRVNNYGVENTTNNPFYGIKFEYQSGTEIKNSDSDEFRYTVSAADVAAMTSMQVEAKAGTLQGIATLEGCDFTSELPCGDPVRDPDGYFAFYFMGAVDNGDGTLTLVFKVQNLTAFGLSHATFGLPSGVVPSTPTGNYQSEVCISD